MLCGCTDMRAVVIKIDRLVDNSDGGFGATVHAKPPASACSVLGRQFHDHLACIRGSVGVSL